MLRLFISSQLHLLGLALRALVPRRGAGWAGYVRPLLMLVFVPLFALIQLIHWLGLALDELLYPDYRRVQIREPLFILGVPRSGTTHLHRVLAEDPGVTTFTTWECLFALSISARRFWLGLGRLDARLGAPLARLLRRIERYAFGALDAVHSMRLDDPEEDYFALLPALACFILVLPFPDSRRLWQMGSFDRDMPEPLRSRLLEHYHRCLQRHLYVHGTDKRLLSKNAAFAPLAEALRARYPDARFVVCLRAPQETLPSQLSSIAGGAKLFGIGAVEPAFERRMTEQLGFYYHNLERVLADVPRERCAWVSMEQLRERLGPSIETIYSQLGLTLEADYRARLQARQRHARSYRSAHQYSLTQFGLDPERIEHDLGACYRRLRARVIDDRDAPPSAAPPTPPQTTEAALPC
ncbi:hypothetical protein MARPU_04105 [Marichromatium purpuratum 984]|uniref:Sulfotransferase n=1 Tax=Marichromatium purpuratum 984 TaxID=765910 RepID=W0E0W7_MARPU|nr:sulfotransferase [Marichromatium purpuratum]AHF03153.1 hypothetical protein MARPU_04105 [Marichromatium purpuratum 984]